jgi:hypothetical protein
MAAKGGYRIQMVGPGRASVRPGRGRHRLGSRGLHHCRELRAVRVRLANGGSTRHAAAMSRARVGAEVFALMLAAMIVSTVLVSGWYAAAGAAVIADMVGR